MRKVQYEDMMKILVSQGYRLEIANFLKFSLGEYQSQFTSLLITYNRI